MPPLFSKSAGVLPRVQSWLCASTKTVGVSQPVKIRDSELMHDMLVIPVADLLKLQVIPEHPEALSTGLLEKWSPDMEGKVIFVSHQWLGYSDPDPAGEQFTVLKRALSRLMDGTVSAIELSVIYKCYFKNTHVTASEWKEALPNMYVWIDYACIPQVHANSDSSHVRAAAKAVRSLPGYVERSAMMLVLAPLCSHREAGVDCNYATWRSRGWCRAELMFALLARRHVRVLVVTGSATTPLFLPPACALRLPAGEGSFTCCALDHKVEGRNIECDKARVGATLQAMIAAKVLHLRTLGLHDSARYFTVFQQSITNGLQDNSSGRMLRWSSSMESRIKLEQQLVEEVRARGTANALSALLDWKGQEDEDRARGTGFTLLFWAAFAGCAPAVRELAAQNPGDVNLPLAEGAVHLEGFLKRATPLMAAMAYARWDTVRALLDAGADPTAVCDRGMNPLCIACLTNNLGNVQAWLQHFPDFDLEQPDKFFGDTALSIAAFACTESGPICRALIRARANVNHLGKDGGSVLHKVAFKEDSDPEVLKLLIDAGCDPNYQSRPKDLKWHALFRGVGMGRAVFKVIRFDCPIVKELSRWHKTTPLHHAAVRGDASCVRLLVSKRALPLKDGMGRTPLEAAAASYGGQVPEALVAALRDSSENASGLNPESNAQQALDAAAAALEEAQRVLRAAQEQHRTALSAYQEANQSMPRAHIITSLVEDDEMSTVV